MLARSPGAHLTRAAGVGIALLREIRQRRALNRAGVRAQPLLEDSAEITTCGERTRQEGAGSFMWPRTWFALCGLLLLTIAPRIAAAQVIPAGTIVNVRTTQPIAADYSQPGMRVTAIVDDPVSVDGRILVPRGAKATLEVVHVEQSSTMKGRDRITLKLHALHVNGYAYPVATSRVELKGPSEGKRAARKIVGGAGIGAAVGGIFGGGTGAAVGATMGGATGGVVAGSGKTHLNVPAETRLQFRLTGATRIPR
jgi:hypothetical protein